MKKDLILAFETNIGGGSISLIKDDIEIDSFIGDVKKSGARAENLLINISEMFRRNKVKPEDLKALVYACDEISRTGFRIVSAIVRGFKDSIGCEVFEVSILEVLANISGYTGNILVAVQLNEKFLYRCLFERSDLTEKVSGLEKPETFSAEIFSKELKSLDNSSEVNLVFVGENDEMLKDFSPKRVLKFNSSTNFGSIIAKNSVIEKISMESFG